MPAVRRDSAFINIAYDLTYTEYFLAYVAGIAAFGLTPRATLELTGGKRRLERIFKLLEDCKYSFHDLSFVKLDRRRPVTPRFNMPFELGLVVGWQNAARSGHDWFVFESKLHRIKKSLSDLDGTDVFVYESPEDILREIRNALSKHEIKPTAEQMWEMFDALREEGAPSILRRTGAKSVFEPRPFADLIVLARQIAQAVVPGLPEDP